MRFTQLLMLFLSMIFTTMLLGQEVGLASFYSDKYHGRKTSSGETYNRSELTGAHKSLPFGTLVRVTRLDNNESVVVRVNDRMPDIKGRVIDLSGRAADMLDMVSDGIVRVKLQPVDGRSEGAAEASRPRDRDVVITPPTRVPTPATTTTTVVTPPVTTPPQTTITTPTPGPNEEVVVTIERDPTPVTPPATTRPTPPRATTPTTPRPQPTTPATTTAKAPVAKTYVPTGLYAISLRQPSKTGYGVQVASMSTYDNALKQVAELQAKYFDNVLISIQPGVTAGERTFKIILGPFDTQEAATRYKKDLKSKKKMAGFVVPLSKF